MFIRLVSITLRIQDTYFMLQRGRNFVTLLLILSKITTFTGSYPSSQSVLFTMDKVHSIIGITRVQHYIFKRKCRTNRNVFRGIEIIVPDINSTCKHSLKGVPCCVASLFRLNCFILVIHCVICQQC